MSILFRNSVFKNILCIFLACLTACGVCWCFLFYQNKAPIRLAYSLIEDNLVQKILFSVMFFPFAKVYTVCSRQRHALYFPNILLSLFFSTTFLLGFSQQASDSAFFAIPGIGLLGNGLIILSLSCLFYCLLEMLHQWLCSAHPYMPFLDCAVPFPLEYIIPSLLFLFWFPYWLLCLPGSVPYDTHVQLLQTWKILPLSNANPFFDTFLYGVLYQIGSWGRRFDNGGIALISSLQFILYIVSFTYCVLTVYQITHSRFFAFALTIFYGVVPLYGAAVQTIIKDSLHMPIMVLYFSFLLRALYFPLQKRFLLKFTLLFLVAALTRKAALSYVLAGALVLWFFRRREQNAQQLLFTAILCTICFLCIENLLYPAFGVQKAPEREVLSIPIQGVSFITLRHFNELPQDLLTDIDRVLGIETIANYYEANRSDPMKLLFTSSGKELLPLYFSLIRRYPLDGLKSILTTSWKYFFPFANERNAFRFYIEDFSQLAPHTQVNIHYLFPRLCSLVSYYTKIWARLPILSLFTVPGSCSWVYLFTATSALRKKMWKLQVLFIPLCILLVGFIFTPVNGEVRYSFPLMAIVPMLVALVYGKPDRTLGDNSVS